MSLSSELEQEALFKREFPSLRFDTDQDIERYFELRRLGMHQQALDIYRHKLLPKYPMEEQRVALLRAYRMKDGSFQLLLRESMIEYAYRVVARIKVSIDSITAPLQGVKLSNTYKAILAVEDVIKLLPEDRTVAMDMLERFIHFSRTFRYKADATIKTYELVRQYFYESGFEETLDQLIERKNAEREAQRAQTRKVARVFDLSKVKFNPQDVKRIEIPNTIVKKEDKVIAYCFRYWELALDPKFERIIFLYSRKYHTNHYEVFDIVKRCRATRGSDEVMLNAVSNALTTGYSYSVQGDLYLQAMWRKAKENLYAQASAGLLSAPEDISVIVANAAPAKAADDNSPEKSWAPDVTPEVLSPVERTGRPRGIGKDGKPEKGAKASEAKEQAAAEKAAKKEAERQAREEERLRKRTEALAAKAERSKTLAKHKKGVFGEPRPEAARASGSVSDHIKRLSGRSYDVYREIFAERSRGSIRTYLSAHRNSGGGRGLFDGALNEAEELVYQFLIKNYDNPYMNWDKSRERESVESLGFELPSVVPVIERCFQAL
jgi:hypothetical protein